MNLVEKRESAFVDFTESDAYTGGWQVREAFEAGWQAAINLILATPPRAGSETTEREAFERDASETWGCALSLERKADGEYSELFAEWAWAGWKARASLSTASALPDVIQERDFWMDRCGELEEQLSQADEADHQVQGVMGAEVRESDQQLMRFYSVETIPALIDAQERHIERLQAKFPPLRDEQPRNPRIG
jgi:hypothetical protein